MDKSILEIHQANSLSKIMPIKTVVVIVLMLIQLLYE